jgi:hypothetical protein
VSELATNAVLHTRSPYEVAVRTAGPGIRIDLIDRRPAALPSPMPRSGSAADLTAESTTGRGLGIVAALAVRWGYDTSTTAKSVWVELEAGAPVHAAPVVTLGHSVEGQPGDVTMRMQNMPVRAAVGSGVQVDELVRELQLGPLGRVATAEEVAELFRLLDVSAPVRLAGRHAALQAAAAGHLRFDVGFSCGVAALAAVAELSQLLEALPARESGSTATPTSEVLKFRAWVQSEVFAQLGGAAPTECPLPA